jgi:hypothetical protein
MQFQCISDMPRMDAAAYFKRQPPGGASPRLS